MRRFRKVAKWFQSWDAIRVPSKIRRPATSQLEVLESRILLYATSGNAWPNKNLITISFMPDGTNLGGGYTSNLQGTFNTKFGTAATWQNEILKAAQFWAQQTNINFSVVSDNGAASGSGTNQQGDPNFGDIRIGGYSFGNTTLAQAYAPPPVNNYSIAGDIQFNTGMTFNKGSTYDLFTVATHEVGHALGLLHSTTTSAVMYGTYSSVRTALNADDITGIKSVYSAGAARTADTYEANETTSAAKVVTLDSTSKAAVINELDLTTSTDVDYFKITVPSGATTTLKATVATSGLSLMSPKVEIIVGSTTKASGAAGATEYGVNKTATYTSSTDLAAGKVVYVKVSSANAVAAFKTGKYSLIVNMGTGADPVYTKPTTTMANGSTLSSGGGLAYLLQTESKVNSTTAEVQSTNDRAVATSISGSSVAVWTSANQDGSDVGIYSQRFNKDGTAVGGEVRINTTTTGDQLDPAVAMDALGNYVVTWTSLGQDGSGAGIYAQRYFLDGTPNGSEFRVNSTTANDQTAPAVACDEIGNFVVTWTSALQDGSGLGVYGQRFNLLGGTVGGEFKVNTFTTGDQSDSAVVMNRLSSDFVVTWVSAGQDGAGKGIYAQRFSSNGGASGSEFKINSTTAGDQTDPSIAINRFNGSFVVSWTSPDASGTGIFLQRFNSAGVAQGTQLAVNTTTAGDQNDSSIALDAGGNIFATWSSLSSIAGVGWQICAQQVSANGTKDEPEMVVNATSSADQLGASVAIDLFGNTTVIWSGNGTGDDNGVFRVRYRTDLHPLDTVGHKESAGQHADSDEVVPNSPRPESARLDHRFEAGSGSFAEDRRERLLERLREPTSQFRATAASVNAAQTAPRHSHNANSQDSVKLELAIDRLFGSESWLNGRHYRNP